MRGALAVILLLLAKTALAADTDLSIDVDAGTAAPGQTVIVSGIIVNLSDSDSGAATVSLHLPSIFTFVDKVPVLFWDCHGGAGFVDCAMTQPPHSYTSFGLRMAIAGDAQPGVYAASATITGSNRDPDESNNHSQFQIVVSRHLVVDRAGDSGEGSFRAAIEIANALCDGSTPCSITFDGVNRIEPLTPLPAITAANLTIGTPVFPPAPSVELAGSNVRSGDGLVLRSSGYVGIDALIINGFPGNGIFIDDSPNAAYTIAGSYIGTDRTGTRAVPNGSRGIMINAPSSRVDVHTSVLSGNGRSGIFIWSGGSTALSNNRIGVAAHSNDAVPNGAAGVFISKRTHGTSIDGGIIALNPGFGIAIERGASFVVVSGTLVSENGGPDIDWGLDGPSSDANGIPQTPVLTSATYDAATDTTTIRGDFRRECPLCGVVIWASDHVNAFGTTPLAQQVSPVFGIGSSDPFTFVLQCPGDYRGLFVSAVSYLKRFPDLPVEDSSEPSLAIRVSP
jgi:hypothetical protein